MFVIFYFLLQQQQFCLPDVVFLFPKNRTGFAWLVVTVNCALGKFVLVVELLVVAIVLLLLAQLQILLQQSLLCLQFSPILRFEHLFILSIILHIILVIIAVI